MIHIFLDDSHLLSSGVLVRARANPRSILNFDSSTSSNNSLCSRAFRPLSRSDRYADRVCRQMAPAAAMRSVGRLVTQARFGGHPGSPHQEFCQSAGTSSHLHPCAQHPLPYGAMFQSPRRGRGMLSTWGPVAGLRASRGDNANTAICPPSFWSRWALLPNGSSNRP
jgi:hypothetical protein